ncbi:hypothetical protein HFU84_13240, partial [Acidithiobacillus sp. CV18-2]|nr:hypothetical protein [Acidithiobacillus sp. CV18-2]
MTEESDIIAANLDLVARQAILDAKGNVQAYELLAREEYSPTEDPFLASAQVLVKGGSKNSPLPVKYREPIGRESNHG